MPSLLAALLLLTLPPQEGSLPRVLFLSHSAGYRHEVVARPAPDRLSLAEERLVAAARDRFQVEPTQDCGVLHAEGLAAYDAVVFYTTGELPVPEGGAQALLRWVEEGGAFVGVHSATDTFYEVPAYQEMLGGVFDGHPWHEEVVLRVEHGDHPALAGVPPRWTVRDEIYQYRDWQRHPTRVLLSLEPGSVEVELGRRADGDYALAWWRDWGQGRVFATGLGHRAELWHDETFLAHLLGGLEWAIAGPDLPCPPPPDALVLVGGGTAGQELGSLWEQRDGSPLAWDDEGGVLVVAPGSGDALSRTTFGDALVHVEFLLPDAGPEAAGQARANSGVYLHGRYEVQILDSFGVPQPTAGDCGGVYGVSAPRPGACRPSGRWQSYDIRFQAPRFDAQGTKSAAARLSVWHNGMPVQRDVVVEAPTGGAHGEEGPRGPLLLQDHGHPVRFRNVWIAPLGG